MFRKLFFMFLMVFFLIPFEMIAQRRPLFFRQKIHGRHAATHGTRHSDIYIAEDATIQNIIVYEGRHYREYGVRGGLTLPRPFEVVFNLDIEYCNIYSDWHNNVVTEIKNGYVYFKNGVPQIIPKLGCHQRIIYTYYRPSVWKTMEVINIHDGRRYMIKRKAHY